VEHVIKKKPMQINQHQVSHIHQIRGDPFAIAQQRPEDVPLPEIIMGPRSHPLRGSEGSEIKV